MTSRSPILGDPSVLERMRDESTKGSLLAARPRYVREQYGEDALQDLHRRLPDHAARHLNEEILPFAWYPFTDLMEIDRCIVEGPMQGRVERMEHFGATIASYDLPTLYRMLFRFGSPAFIVKRIGVVYKTYLRPGTAQTENVGDNQATVAFQDAVYPEYFCRYGVSGWFRSAIEMSGGSSVQVDHYACLHAGDPQCRWQATWS